MTNNSYPNIKSLIINVLTNFSIIETLKACRQTFIINSLTCFSCIKGKINFLQMERFSDKSEQYYRINFENKFNFQHFNLSMIKDRLTECVVAFDPGYIKKSGRKTFGPGMYGPAVRLRQNGGWTSAVLPQLTLSTIPLFI